MEELLETPLSASDLEKLYPANVLIYKNLKKYNTIDSILKNDACYILFQTFKENYGHWVVLIRNGNVLEFFDPYGIFIENQKEYVEPEFFQPINFLSNLMKNSSYEIHYNEYAFQNMNVSTCGRWCGIRAFNRKMSLEEFKDKIIDLCDEFEVSPDVLSVLLTFSTVYK